MSKGYCNLTERQPSLQGTHVDICSSPNQCFYAVQVPGGNSKENRRSIIETLKIHTGAILNKTRHNLGSVVFLPSNTLPFRKDALQRRPAEYREDVYVSPPPNQKLRHEKDPLRTP